MNVSCELAQLRRGLASIPAIDAAEARKLVADLSRRLRAAERAAAKAVRQAAESPAAETVVVRVPVAPIGVLGPALVGLA